VGVVGEFQQLGEVGKREAVEEVGTGW